MLGELFDPQSQYIADNPKDASITLERRFDGYVLDTNNANSLPTLLSRSER